MKRIDELDTRIIDNVTCCKGHPIPFGATAIGENRINFSISASDATTCILELYHIGDKKPYARIKIPEDYRIGDNYSVIVFDQNVEELEYTYRFDGPRDIKKGYRYDPDVPLIDPYARLLSGREKWRDEAGHKRPLRGRIIYDDFDWEGDRPLERHFSDLVIYEMHVRGFTIDPASSAARKGTYAGVIEMIPYLKKLGINCVELLPVFEFDELDYPYKNEDHRLCNYWGYSPICFFAPKSAYAAAGVYGMAADELKNMIKKLHQNGIEVILDVVFNHTAERGEGGPTYSYRGIDNRIYYHLDDNGNYIDYSGCGNTMNCNHAIVRQHILDCMRYWVSEYHIDGFRFDEASILSRDEMGSPMPNPPLLENLSRDPILARAKLIAEAWDAAGLYQVGSFPAPEKWSEWNGRYRDCVRRFIKSDATAGPELLYRIQGSPDIYPGKRFNQTVNFVTCHDGFTLNDLVSYNEKHNEMNGEENRDGVNDNISWNCGVEGDTDDSEIEALRNRQVKNVFALLMLSRGTPMMLSGDEFRNSQKGNNNVYCIDSEVSWLNWEDKEKHSDVFKFFSAMIKLRNDHPVLRSSDYKTSENSTGYPELSFHGEKPWNLNMWEPFHTFGFMYAESAKDYKVKKDSYIYCGVNAHWEAHTLELPTLPEGFVFKKYLYTADTVYNKHPEVFGSIELMPRSLMVLIGSKA